MSISTNLIHNVYAKQNNLNPHEVPQSPSNLTMDPANLQFLWNKSIKQHEQDCYALNTIPCHCCFLIKAPKDVLQIISDYDDTYWNLDYYIKSHFLKMHPDETKILREFLNKRKKSNCPHRKYKILNSTFMRGFDNFFLNLSRSYWNECLSQSDEKALEQSESYQNWMTCHYLNHHFPKNSEIIKTINNYVKENFVLPKFDQQIQALNYCSNYQSELIEKLVKSEFISQTEFVKGAYAYLKKIAIEYTGGFILMPIRYRVKSHDGEGIYCPVKALITNDLKFANASLKTHRNLIWYINNHGENQNIERMESLALNDLTPSSNETEMAQFFLLHNSEIFFISLKKGMEEGTQLNTNLNSTIWDIDTDREAEIKKKRLTSQTLLIAQYSWAKIIDIF